MPFWLKKFPSNTPPPQTQVWWHDVVCSPCLVLEEVHHQAWCSNTATSTPSMASLASNRCIHPISKEKALFKGRFGWVTKDEFVFFYCQHGWNGWNRIAEATQLFQDISNRQCSLSLGRNLNFWGAKSFSKFFSPSVPLGSVCGAWAMGPQLPEAKHRCTTQPARATAWQSSSMGWSSGSSRPRRRWMRRTKRAGASSDGFGDGKLLEAMGSLREEVDEMLMVQVFEIPYSTILWKVYCQNFWHWYVVFFLRMLKFLGSALLPSFPKFKTESTKIEICSS